MHDAQTLPGSTVPTSAMVYGHTSPPTIRASQRSVTQQPLHLIEGPGAVLYSLWCELDSDNDGLVDRSEFSYISSRLGVKWDANHAWTQVVAASDQAETQYIRQKRKESGQQITFQGFVAVYNRLMGQARRSCRLDVKATFEKLQTRPEGLHKEGVSKLYRSTRHLLLLLPPIFEIERDWALMQQLSDDDEEQETIVFMVFERWWKFRMGLQECDTPVIPEFFQFKLSELQETDALRAGRNKSRTITSLSSGLKGRIRQYHEDDDAFANESVEWAPRTPQKLWKLLRQRLHMLVTMRRDWGNVNDFYGNRDSEYGETVLASYVRDPESRFSSNWDLLQVIFLCFVSYTVPYRAGFGVEIDLLTTWWYVDTIIDVYFITDLILNFFTAFYDVNGKREGRPKVIAQAYLRGWFVIDFVSCLPVQYIMLLFDNGTADKEGGNFRVIKGLRLLRLSKMLRLARIKRILAKYENLEFVQQYSGMLALMFIIAFAGHLLACFWYMIGVTEGVNRQGDQIPGWALLEYCEKCADPTDSGYAPCDLLEFQDSQQDCPSTCDWIPEAPGTHGTTGAACVKSDGCVVGCELDPSVSMSTRYITSMYYVFNALDGNGRTDGERAFAIFGYIIMVIIDGAVAGVLSAVMISMGGTERIVNEKLAAAKAWMREHHISKPEQTKALNYFRHVYRSHVMYQEGEILNTVRVPIFCTAHGMPPSMRVEFSMHLYATHLAQIPLFRGLGKSVMLALCGVVEPMLAVRGQVIFAEGHVGQEMYVLITGELEITCNQLRLGFLSDGAFFGETPLLDSSSEAEERRRTVTAVTDSKLCFIRKEALEQIKPKYPELALKLKRCARFDKRRQVNKKGKRFKMALHEATSSPLPGLSSPFASTFGQTWSNSDEKRRPPPVRTPLLPSLSSGAAAGTPQADHLAALSQRMDVLQEMVVRMDGRSEQTAKSVETILQHLKLQASSEGVGDAGNGETKD